MSRNTTNDDCQACDEYRRLSRREFMARGDGDGCRASVPASLPRVTYAQSASSSDVLISIFLRGGADGLSLVPPFGDRRTARCGRRWPSRRPGALANPALDLDGFFGFRRRCGPAAGPGGQLLIVQRLGRPIRHVALRRAVLHGIGKPGDLNMVTGWLGGTGQPPACEGRCGAERHRVQLWPAADARRRAGHAAHSRSRELRPLRKLEHPHAAPRVARQRIAG